MSSLSIQPSAPPRTSRPPPRDPPRFGSYEIVRKLGEGGMGTVYEARRVDLEKRVALKVLTQVEGPSVTARFLQEARIAASLDHPHVVNCIDLGQHNGTAFLAMEFLEGETLRERMERGALSATESVDLILPVCSALALAHDQGIIHRDIKPENIFLARRLNDTVPKVLDFGIAKSVSSTARPGITQTATIIGTPGYMAPEQVIDSKRVTPATDQFALGSVLWACVAGEELYRGEAAIEVLFAAVYEPARPLASAAPTAPQPFCDAVARMLDRDPTRRFASVREAAHALLPFASPRARARWEHEFGAPISPTLPPDEPARPLPAPVRPAVMTVAQRKQTPAAPDETPTEELPVARAEPPSRVRLVAAIATVIAVAVTAAFLLSRTPPAQTTARPPVTPVATAPTPASTPAEPPTPTPAPIETAQPPSPIAQTPSDPPHVAPNVHHAPTRATPVRPARHPHLRHRNL
jgi:serine/threonine-protein kinase